MILENSADVMRSGIREFRVAAVAKLNKTTKISVSCCNGFPRSRMIHSLIDNSAFVNVGQGVSELAQSEENGYKCDFSLWKSDYKEFGKSKHRLHYLGG
jgi:hypothetical protein